MTGLPLTAIASAAALASPLPVLVPAPTLGALVARTALRARTKTSDHATRIAYAVHSHLQQLPIMLGQFAFHLDRGRGRRRALIEYNEPAR